MKIALFKELQKSMKQAVAHAQSKLSLNTKEVKLTANAGPKFCTPCNLKKM